MRGLNLKYENLAVLPDIGRMSGLGNGDIRHGTGVKAKQTNRTLQQIIGEYDSVNRFLLQSLIFTHSQPFLPFSLG